MRILAIDPGYERMGVAVLEKNSGKENLIFSECFRTSAKLPHAERLVLVGREVRALVKKYRPDAVALETLFFEKNQKTAMHVAEARGVLLFIAAEAGLPAAEFTPMEIKVAVTGYGKSDKWQVTSMVERLVNIKKAIKYDDEYDAIAVGLTYFATHHSAGS
ncbi:MAG: crossover junction endodeoxyribonuclease RuvC [Patescibacteria group bacterium]|nr:crossover junction endodeoxyribonuclease RuvC [Patescibacteria group bacterium]MDE1945758.1 crossover junction endodeoxyribonuclease RuvC [Patescibacteria group bacterium]